MKKEKESARSCKLVMGYSLWLIWLGMSVIILYYALSNYVTYYNNKD